ncbi:NUDIX hydrolase [Clostridium combesii]|nr:NUDIX domain-containing protein [Clostridium combesii]
MDKTIMLRQLKSYKPDTIQQQEFQKQTITFVENNKNFYSSHNNKGHLTGSACILDYTKSYILINKHKIFSLWMYLGGHCEQNDKTILSTALREATEESGLTTLTLLTNSIIDIDIHKIMRYKNQEEHLHYDIRFLFETDRKEFLKISKESYDLQWVKTDEIENYTTCQSVIRVLKKIKIDTNL